MSNINVEVWRLCTDCNRDLVIRTAIDYFQTHFVGKSMVESWEPPAIRIQGKSKRLRDFVSWMLSAPVISEKARQALEELIAPYAEILPLIKLRGKPYYALNVTKVVDCLDRDRSDISYSPTDGRVMNIWRYSFRKESLKDVPIFQLPEGEGQIFVTRSFVDVVIASRLRGAAFADPGVSPFAAILKGKSQNIVPGVAE